MKAIIMCGGSGTRLWPISTTSSPKQFVPLFDNKSLFELTIERNKEFVNGFIIVVNEEQLPLCKKQFPKDIKDVTFIIEPKGRNTAPAITLASLLDPNETYLVLASDHLIKNHIQYKKVINRAIELSQDNNLVTFGITPHYPETGYGYIEAQDEDVLSFKEKPNYEIANQYLKDGNYYWNSGMFLFKSQTYLDELKKYHPKILSKSEAALKNSKKEANIFYINLEDMLQIPSDSIDYAVMEKSKNVKVVPSNIQWSDLGSFDSLYNEFEKDSQGNTIDDNHIHIKSKNNFVKSSQKTIATFGVEDLIIVETEDTILIGKRGQGQEVKNLLTKYLDSKK